MFKEGLGQKKVLFGSQRGRTANGQTATSGFPALPAPERQISGFLPASGSIENQTDSDSSLLPHLARFLARLAHNSFNILLAHQSLAGTSFSEAILQN